MRDVEELFKKNVEPKKQLRGYNSFVSPHPYYEFQVDLFFINDLEKQKFKVGMVILDVFSRYAVVIPIKSKSEGDVASGLIEGLNKFDKSPQMIYIDDEKALSTEAMQKYLKEKISIIILPEDTQTTVKDLSAHTRICFTKGLKPMKRKTRKTLNGLTTILKYF